ncbi:hypothetical protein [Gloeocapsopsis dulcis]|nr:hypothetical protein [Gloeocapsopsis dulcis]
MNIETQVIGLTHNLKLKTQNFLRFMSAIAAVLNKILKGKV